MENNHLSTVTLTLDHSGSPLYTAWQQQLTEAAHTPELRQQLAARQHELLPRFAAYYSQLHTLPRRMRRALQRQWKQSLAGMALLLTLGQAPALAATITISPGITPAIGPDGRCSLIEAIRNANADAAVHSDCVAGSGADTLVLPVNSTQTLIRVNTNAGGSPTGLPIITSDITLAGNGSTIRRASSAPDFRIFNVERSGNLTLQETTVSGGRTSVGGQDGGGIRNSGTLTLTESILSGNSTVGNSSNAGGVHNSGTLTLTSSTLSNNSTSGSDSGGGGVVNASFARMTVLDSTLSGNFTLGSGSPCGGIDNNGYLSLTNSTLSGNSTTPEAAAYVTAPMAPFWV